MKTLAFSILFMVAAASFASTHEEGRHTFSGAQQCDCTITPFKPSPPCFDTCSAKLLSRSTKIELEVAFGLKKETAEAVLAWQSNIINKNRAMTISELTKAKVLTKSESDELVKRIDSFNQEQLAYFAKPRPERGDITASALGKIF